MCTFGRTNIFINRSFLPGGRAWDRNVSRSRRVHSATSVNSGDAASSWAACRKQRMPQCDWVLCAFFPQLYNSPHLPAPQIFKVCSQDVLVVQGVISLVQRY